MREVGRGCERLREVVRGWEGLGGVGRVENEPTGVERRLVGWV